MDQQQDSGFKVIPVSRGMVTVVDADVFEWASQYRWNANADSSGEKFYATRIKLVGKQRIFISLHRLIMGATEGQNVDHINGNGLDNRRDNLRLCTHAQNMGNQRKRKGTSKYKGVSFAKHRNVWVATIKDRYIGAFGSEIEAAHAYDAQAIIEFGSFSRLNFPTETGAISCLAQ